MFIFLPFLFPPTFLTLRVSDGEGTEDDEQLMVKTITIFLLLQVAASYTLSVSSQVQTNQITKNKKQKKKK